MDPELWDVIKRYSIVALVLTGALVWAVMYTPTMPGGVANNAPALEAPQAAPPAADASADEKNFTLVRHGLRRIACAAACDLEVSCQLRRADVCINESCEGDVRKVNRSDFHLAAAADCAAVASSSCEEACWRKAECGSGHGGDKACTAACTSLMTREPQKTWRQARCILEVKNCDDVARCDQG